jgi:hypothetical protein
MVSVLLSPLQGLYSLDILHRPKDENGTAQDFRPKENRPERAVDRRALFPEITLVESDSMAIVGPFGA